MTALWFDTALLADGWARRVRISGSAGVIDSVETESSPQVGDERGALALPGVCNLHSHAFQRGMAGLAETRGVGSDDFWTWREVMYRFVEHLTPDDLEAIAAQAFIEMMESGFTRVGEFHYLHHDRRGKPFGDPAEMIRATVAAAETSGLGLTLLAVFYAHGGFGGAAPGPAQARFVNHVNGYGRLIEAARRAVSLLPDAGVGIAPHSLRAVTPDELIAILPLAGPDPVHIHIAEQMAEVEDCLAWAGCRPLEWLFDHAPVDERWCLVHATHAEPSELRRIVRSGAVVGLCPVTEANLGDGVFPARAFLAEGGRFGVGSDSNVLIDLAEELRLLEYGQRLTQRSRAVLASDQTSSVGRSLFDHAMDGGAQALCRPGGRIAAGQSFDLVSLRSDSPALAARAGDALLDGWIFAARGGAVDGVWRRGVKLVEGGVHLRRPAVSARFRRTLERLAAL